MCCGIYNYPYSGTRYIMQDAICTLEKKDHIVFKSLVTRLYLVSLIFLIGVYRCPYSGKRYIIHDATCTLEKQDLLEISYS